MRDNQRRAVLHELIQACLHGAFGLGIERGGGLIEHENRRVFQHGAGHGHTLLLTAGELQAALTNDGVVAIWELLDEAVRIGAFGHGDDLVHRRAGFAVGDVLLDGAGEKIGLLEHHTDRCAQAFCRELGHVMTQHRQLSCGWLVQAQQQVDQRGLAAA